MTEDTEALKALVHLIQVGNRSGWSRSWNAAVVIKAREALPALERMLASQGTESYEAAPGFFEELSRAQNAPLAAPVASQMGEPVAWMYTREGYYPAVRWDRNDEGLLSSPEWTRTPLYAAPASGMDVWQCAEDICAYLMRELGHDTDNIDRDEIAAIIRKYT